MLHAIIGLVIATVLLIGWGAGNLFACVFLSIPVGLGMLVFILQTPSNLPWALACMVVLVVIWAPRWHRRRAMAYPIYRQQRTPIDWAYGRRELKTAFREFAGVVVIGTVLTLIMMPLFLL